MDIRDKGFRIDELMRREHERYEIEHSLGGRIKKIRSVYGLTQKEFADLVQVTHAHISKIENGKDSPSNSLLALIMAKFNINENWMNNTLDGKEAQHEDMFIFKDYGIFISNLKYLQKKFGLSKREMEGLFSSSSYHLDNKDYLILNGVHTYIIQQICDYFKISMYDIINKRLNTEEVEQKKDSESKLSADENTLLEIFNSCTPADKKLIISILNKFQN